MNGKRLGAGIVVALLALGGTFVGQSQAQSEGMDHSGHDMGAMMMAAPAGASEATKGYVEAMNRMMQAMAPEFTGDPDIDFMVGMIPHHQGAVDAARIVLEHGSDPEVRAFAEQVIAAQEAEIAWMTAWLEARGK